MFATSAMQAGEPGMKPLRKFWNEEKTFECFLKSNSRSIKCCLNGCGLHDIPLKLFGFDHVEW